MLGDFERVLEALNTAGVRCLVVDGVAIALHGQLRTPTLEVDLFARALKVPLENTFAWVVSLPDLIAFKRQARRPRDFPDIEALDALEADGDGDK